MSQSPELDGKKRVVSPPVTGNADSSSPVISVVLEDDEEISWIWTHYPSGQSVATGYEIIKRDGEKARFDIEKAAVADSI